jgi:hypothetical protein
MSSSATRVSAGAVALGGSTVAETCMWPDEVGEIGNVVGGLRKKGARVGVGTIDWLAGSCGLIRPHADNNSPTNP